MGVRRDLLLWFVLLYGMLYCSFGLSSPFLPEFLTTRGVGAEWLGFLLGAGTAVRLLSAPLAGRLADVCRGVVGCFSAFVVCGLVGFFSCSSLPCSVSVCGGFLLVLVFIYLK